MRLKNMFAMVAATAMAVAPVAASANPAAALSVAAVQDGGTEEAAGGSGGSAGTVIGIVLALAAISIGVIASGDDSPSSP